VESFTENPRGPTQRGGAAAGPAGQRDQRPLPQLLRASLGCGVGGGFPSASAARLGSTGVARGRRLTSVCGTTEPRPGGFFPLRGLLMTSPRPGAPTGF